MIALLAVAATALPPVEQCRGDAGFDAVRAQFVKAVRMRDSAMLAAISSDDVGVDDIGLDQGHAKLREWMSGEFGERFWPELEPAIEGGCSESEGKRVLPSFATRLSGDEEMIVAAPREPIRAAPSDDAKILGYAKWEWVDHNFADSGPFYWHVRLRSGRIGYIRSERIYSALSPYAEFERRDGKWQLVTLRLIPAD